MRTAVPDAAASEAIRHRSMRLTGSTPVLPQGFLDRLVERALRMDGTCSGEHGVGQGKIRYLAQEQGTGVDVMIAIKKALDPLNILNPGKIFALP